MGHGLVRAGEELFLSPEFFSEAVFTSKPVGRTWNSKVGPNAIRCEDYGNEWVEFKGDRSDGRGHSVDSLVTEMGKAHLGWVDVHSGGIKSMYPTFFSKKPVRSDVSFSCPEACCATTRETTVTSFVRKRNTKPSLPQFDPDVPR